MLPPVDRILVSKNRRIEITAFRLRRTVVMQGNTDSEAPASEATGTDIVRNSVAQGSLMGESMEPPWIMIEGASPELMRLIEALVNSDGDAVKAARHVGLSRHKFYIRLARLGWPFRRLQIRLRALVFRRKGKTKRSST